MTDQEQAREYADKIAMLNRQVETGDFSYDSLDSLEKAKELVQSGLDNLSEAEIEEGLDDVLEKQKAGYSGYAGLSDEQVQAKSKSKEPAQDLFNGGISKEAVDELYSEKDSDFGKKKD